MSEHKVKVIAVQEFRAQVTPDGVSEDDERIHGMHFDCYGEVERRYECSCGEEMGSEEQVIDHLTRQDDA